MERDQIFGTVITLGVAVSGGVHLRLYRGGYRNIHIDSVAGVDLGRSFLLAVVGAAVIVVAGLAALARPQLLRPVAVIAGLYALGAIAAYIATRNGGLLGFQDTKTSTEAVVAKSAELLTVLSAGAVFLGHRTARPLPAPVREATAH